MSTLAVLITCHNRRTSTLECIRRASDSALGVFAARIYLVDDGSTDGTAEVVRTEFREVEVIRGTGALYWNGGMRMAFARAMEAKPDFYLFLNDDTYLYPDGLSRLYQTYKSVRANRAEVVIVGSTQDPQTGELTYGGSTKVGIVRKGKFRKVVPTSAPQSCDTMNGNCVLIPAAVAMAMGNLDAAFTHGMGDMDYGLRLKRKGYGLWLAPGYVASCTINRGFAAWSDPTVPLFKRWRHLLSPKGLPVAEWFIFTYRHMGPLWLLHWLNPYVKFWLLALFAPLRRKLPRWTGSR